MDEIERQKLRLDLHASYMEEFNRREAATSDNYDKALMAYTTGALALSVTFVSTFIKDTTKAHLMGCLKGAWIAWVLALVFTIVSFLVSIQAGRKEAEKASRYYLDDQADAITLRNGWAVWLTRITIAGGVLFVAGAAAMMVFVWFNI